MNSLHSGAASDCHTPHAAGEDSEGNHKFVCMDAWFATLDRRGERGGHLPSASVRISFSASTEVRDAALTCQMRRAGDNHSSAQEGVGRSRHPGPLVTLSTHINRDVSSYYEHVEFDSKFRLVWWG